jgi:hypothetical protein
MTDKFPEAFKRFESKHDVRDMDKFSDILAKFSEWQGYRASDLQSRSLANCVDWTIMKGWYKQKIHYRYGDRDVFRSKKSGRFVVPR